MSFGKVSLFHWSPSLQRLNSFTLKGNIYSTKCTWIWMNQCFFLFKNFKNWCLPNITFTQRKPKSLDVMFRNGVQVTTGIIVNHDIFYRVHREKLSKDLLEMHHHCYKGNKLWFMLQMFCSNLMNQCYHKSKHWQKCKVCIHPKCCWIEKEIDSPFNIHHKTQCAVYPQQILY